MQRCQYCGQLNDDFEKSCIYCGENLLKKVDQDSKEVTYEDGDDDFNQMYAMKVAQELIDDDDKPKKRSKKKPRSIDELDDFAKELLRPENAPDDLTTINESLFKNNPLYADEDEEVFITEEELEPKEKEILVDPEPEEDEKVDDEIINIQRELEETPKQQSSEILEELEKQEKPEIQEKPEKQKEPEKEEGILEELEDQKDSTTIEDTEPNIIEDTSLIEADLKKKLKRNRKLETRIGLSMKDINLVVDGVSKHLTITGRVSINQLLEKNFLKISIICFNKSKEPIDTANTILQMGIIKKYYEFYIESEPDLDSIDMIIILPEITNEKPKIQQKKSVESKTKQSKHKSNKKEDVKTKDKNSSKKNKKQSRSKKKQRTSNNPSKKESAQNSIFIENMKDIERKIGLDIKNTSILIKSSDRLVIVGEIYIDDAEKYSAINITATCYDKENKIVATETVNINTKLFLGFDTLNIEIRDIDVSKINRIRLYPTFQ